MSSVKNIGVLTAITVIAGFLLGFVFNITKEPIRISEEKAKQEAYKTVFPEAESFMEADDITVDSDAVLSSYGYNNESVDAVLYASDVTGEKIGYVLTVSTNQGYGGNITLSMGIGFDGKIKGIEFLSISETPGLGMNADTGTFKSQFKNMNATQISYTKTGKSADYEIDAISGATITTNAVTNAVNAGLVYYNSIAGGAANE